MTESVPGFSLFHHPVVPSAVSCLANGRLSSTKPEICYGNPDWFEDIANYNLNWQHPETVGNDTNNVTSSSWTHRTAATLNRLAESF